MKMSSLKSCNKWRYQLGETSFKRQAFANFVAGSIGGNHAFVEKEGHSRKAGELWLLVKGGFEPPDRMAAACAFASRERDMGMIGTSFSGKSALGCRGGNDSLKRAELRSNLHVREKNCGAIKKTQRLNLQRKWLQAQFSQSRHNAGGLFLRTISQKLQSDMPGFGSGPAQPVVRRAKARGDCGEFLPDFCR